MTRDFASGRTELSFDWAAGGRYRLVEAGLQTGYWTETVYSIVPATRSPPRSAARPPPSWAATAGSLAPRSAPSWTADAERFRVRTELEAFENGERVRRREWSFETPRELG